MSVPTFPAAIAERLFAARTEYADASKAAREAADWARKAGADLSRIDVQYRSEMDTYALAVLAAAKEPSA